MESRLRNKRTIVQLGRTGALRRLLPDARRVVSKLLLPNDFQFKEILVRVSSDFGRASAPILIAVQFQKEHPQ